jgi:hypothetical protein
MNIASACLVVKSFPVELVPAWKMEVFSQSFDVRLGVLKVLINLHVYWWQLPATLTQPRLSSQTQTQTGRVSI